MGVVRNLKRCFQALPFSLPALFCSFTISLLAHSFRSATLHVIESTDRKPSTVYVLFNRRENIGISNIVVQLIKMVFNLIGEIS